MEKLLYQKDGAAFLVEGGYRKNCACAFHNAKYFPSVSCNNSSCVPDCTILP